MEKRTRIGFYYVWDKSWMGGVMYARNLLKALNMLADKDKPFIDVYCKNGEAFEDLKTHTRYPYMDKVIINENSLKIRIKRKFLKFFGTMALAKMNRFHILSCDKMLFPYGYGSKTDKLVFWKPDFQEKHLPEYFNDQNIRYRDNEIRTIAKRGIPIVFSSYDSQKDYNRYYSEYKNKTFVVHFAVDHEDFSDIKLADVKAKYNISGDYLLCANQFWKHKNHLFLFKAYHMAIKKGMCLQLVCTGNMSDYRNPEYIDEIKRYLMDNKLEEYIKLPGLIDSKELLCLMKNAYAVVQPSLFEGWNTTVEDCKALNKFVFLSDLPVHREQIQTNVCFFDPHDENDLMEKLLKVVPKDTPFDYSNNLLEFGENFLKVIKDVTYSGQELDERGVSNEELPCILSN